MKSAVGTVQTMGKKPKSAAHVTEMGMSQKQREVFLALCNNPWSVMNVVELEKK